MNFFPCNFFILVLFATFSNSLEAQTIKDIFLPETPITYHGIDFSETRYFGEAGTVSSSEMKILTNKINLLIVSEPAKFNLLKTFSKNRINNNLTLTIKINEELDEDKIITYNYADCSRLTPQIIQSMVYKYNFDNPTGVGLVFIMEGMNKSIEQASIWVTFFNMFDNTVLLTQRVSGKASGISFRNHWSNSVHNIFIKIYTREYKMWKKAYGPSKK